MIKSDFISLIQSLPGTSDSTLVEGYNSPGLTKAELVYQLYNPAVPSTSIMLTPNSGFTQVMEIIGAVFENGAIHIQTG